MRPLDFLTERVELGRQLTKLAPQTRTTALLTPSRRASCDEPVEKRVPEEQPLRPRYMRDRR